MARNLVFVYSKERTRERPVPANTQAGTPLLINTRPCVTITARGDATATTNFADGSSATRPVGGAGNLANSATVAYDGTWEFTGITGVTTSTDSDVAVYITAGGALTTTATSNTLYGYTDYPRGYVKATGKAPIRIGG